MDSTTVMTPATNCPRDSNDWVRSRIQQGNDWYVGDQFVWANRDVGMRAIYRARRRFITNCIERAQSRFGTRMRFLDAGCGDGYWLKALEDVPHLERVGVDYNPLRVERARAINPTVQVYCRPLLNFSADTTFEVVLLSQVIEHVADDLGLLRCVRSLLRPGGVLILGVPNEGSFLQQLQMKRLGADHKTDHVHFYTERKIRHRIGEAGFLTRSVMREVMYVGGDRRYYWFLRRRWGYQLLKALSHLFPSQCSEYSFECIAT